MARAVFAVTDMPTGYDVDGAVATWVACVAGGDGNYCSFTGNEVLLVRNVDAGAPHSITVYSVACAHNRTGDVTKNLLASGYHVFQRFPIDGFLQAGGQLWFTAASASLEAIVLRLV